MRKNQKKQIDELVQSLEIAHSEIEKIINYDSNQAIELLELCQQGAIGLGTLIEQSEGEDFVTVKLLEEYCEFVYLFHEEVVANNFDNTKSMLKGLAKRLIRIKNSVENDIVIKKEMVFFSYKASMWDSFESIWQAAKEDDKYECHVIPIPYFDKNPDGTVASFHYEGDLYPEYVPVEAWEAYNVEENHPDVIFIHNPYDNTNLVTTVHPNYYAKVLRKHTDLLAYVPYFLSGETVQEHYCVNPGTMYADVVFVQSENIRQQYLKYYGEFEKQYNTRELLGKSEEKFVALGSPKVDKVLQSEKEDFSLPEEWQKIISGKKVVLYNTHLSEVLNGGNAFFERLESVMSYFKESEKYALWWRPHPLSEASIASMSPEYLCKYKELVEKYKNEKIGIYDDTPELHRAICYADIYYGSNGGSLVPLWQATGKPMILQNINLRILGDTKENGSDIKLEYHILAKSKKKIYIIVEPINLLVSYSIINENWEIECDLPVDFIEGNYWRIKGFCNNDKLYVFLPVSKEFIIFDCNKREVCKKSIENKTNLLDTEINRNSYSNILVYENKIVILPIGNRKDIIVYDIQSDKFSHFSNWRNELNLLLGENRFVNFRVCSAQIKNDCIYVIARCAKQDVICSIEINEIKITNVTQIVESNRLFGMVCFADKLCVGGFNKNEAKLYWWDGQNIVRTIDISKKLQNISDKRVRIHNVENKKILVQTFGEEIIIEIDCETNEERIISGRNRIYTINNDTYIIDYINNTIQNYSDCNKIICCIDEEKLKLSETEKCNKLKGIFDYLDVKGSVLFCEKKGRLFPDVLNILSVIQDDHLRNNSKLNKNDLIGRKIYNCITSKSMEKKNG